MATIKQIIIPEPCTQQWNQMTPNNNGRHCINCDKTVVDFTLMSNQEIIHYLSNSGNVCGRITAPQFDGINRQLGYAGINNRSNWKKWFMAAALLASSMFHKAVAQSAATSAPTEQGPVSDFTLGKIAMSVSDKKVFEGQVVDEKNIPIPGVGVIVKGANAGSTTDANGKFRIMGPAKSKTLIFRSIGYETIEKNVREEAGKPMIIKLKMVSMMLGGVGVIYSKPSSIKKLYGRFTTKPTSKFFS